MVDYQKVTGKTGLMMIRDTGWTVEFWFKAGYANDWANALDFNWTANGTTTAKAIKYPTGAQWAKVGSVNVGTSQTITFRLLDATGTQGMGGPTTFNQWIERARVPDPPVTPGLGSITSHSMWVWFAPNWDGGAAIDLYEIAWSNNAAGGQNYTTTGGPMTIGGLSSGVTWYFWVRAHNYQGWSGWSGRAQATTLRVPDAPTTPHLTDVTSTTVTASFVQNSNGGSIILEYELGWGIDGGTNFMPSNGYPTVVSGLTPGTVYRFWARARNSVGWGPWSGYSSARTIAGGYISNSSAWKIAVPYVNVGGVWKLAEPWVRSAGTWKRTI